VTKDFLNQMKKLCQCGHARTMHYHGFTIIPQGQDPKPTKKDAECRADNCNCQIYNPVEKDDSSIVPTIFT